MQILVIRVHRGNYYSGKQNTRTVFGETPMKIKGLENIDAGVRSAILISVACAYFAWDLGFEFGVHGTIYFEKIFFVWSISLALLLIFIIIPKNQLPVPPSLWVAAAIPTLWVLIGLSERAAADEVWIRHALTVVGLIAVLGCIPFLAAVITSVIYPDFTRMDSALPKVGISVVIAAMVMIGYLVGINHHRFLTCEDFELSGQSVPENCSRQ
jgi:hypothetical protein